MAFYEEPRDYYFKDKDLMFSCHIEQHRIIPHISAKHYHEMLEIEYCLKGPFKPGVDEKITYSFKSALDRINANS